MTIHLEHEIETWLIEKAQANGRQPEEYVAELLRASRNSSNVNDAKQAGEEIWLRGEYTDGEGWLRNGDGTLLGFDGLTWRQLAHLDHKY